MPAVAGFLKQIIYRFLVVKIPNHPNFLLLSFNFQRLYQDIEAVDIEATLMVLLILFRPETLFGTPTENIVRC